MFVCASWKCIPRTLICVCVRARVLCPRCFHRDLQLWDNDIVHLRAGLLDKLTALETLSISMNRIASLHAPVFEKLTSLRHLTLDWNNISALGEGLLDSLTNLDSLQLGFNAIENLPTGFLTKLPNLRSLSLHGNDIGVLPHGFFERLTSLQALYLHCDPSSSSYCADGSFAASDNPRMTCVPLTSAQISALSIYHGPTQSCQCQAGYAGPDGGCIPCGEGTFITCSSAPWSVIFGGCTFTGDTSGAGLMRAGSCSTQTGDLVLDNKGITSLENSPFDGLFGPDSRPDYGPGSGIVYLRNNRILELSATSGVFDTMTYMNGLDLSGNRIAQLSAPLFDKLTSLVGLVLSNNELFTLGEGVLDKLANLEILILHGNDLADLPAGLFSMLSNLRTLYLRCDPSWGILEPYSRCAAAEDNPRLTCVPLTYAQISRPFDSPSTLGTEGLEIYHGPMLPCECQAGYTGVVAGVCPCNAGYTGPDGADGSGSTCTACPAGKFKTTVGSADCSNCPSGKYSSTVGATADVCLTCPSNTWSNSLPISLSPFLSFSHLRTRK